MRGNSDLSTAKREVAIALKDAFRQDIEILFGYVSMGFCCGVLLKTSGFSAIYALIMSVFVYSGVMQFLAISFFSASATLTALLNIFLITLILNSRQSFYTLIMLEKFRTMDFRRFLNIFWLTDETFAILKTKKPKSDANHFIFFVSLLNYIYWGFGCVLGAVVGGFITFDTNGLEFIMTAIFVVIFIDNLKGIRTPKGYAPAIIGIVTALFWLVLIGEQYFLLVALISSIAILGLCYHKKWDLWIESHLDSRESNANLAHDSHESKRKSAPISSLRGSEATEAIQKSNKDSAQDSRESHLDSKRESTAR